MLLLGNGSLRRRRSRYRARWESNPCICDLLEDGTVYIANGYFYTELLFCSPMKELLNGVQWLKFRTTANGKYSSGTIIFSVRGRSCTTVGSMRSPRCALPRRHACRFLLGHTNPLIYLGGMPIECRTCSLKDGDVFRSATSLAEECVNCSSTGCKEWDHSIPTSSEWIHSVRMMNRILSVCFMFLFSQHTS